MGSTASPKVLVVEDDEDQRLLACAYLERQKFDVMQAENGRVAVEICRENPDLRLVLTDLDMPVMDGFELIQALRREELPYRYILVITSLNGRAHLARALSLGADDYVAKPVWHEEIRLRLQGGIRLLQLESKDLLIFSLAKLAEYRSKETGRHLDRVRMYTRVIANALVGVHPELGASNRLAQEISFMSPLHDVGKVGIPDRILHKEGELEPEEFELMKTHTLIGGRLLRELFEQTHASYLRTGYEIATFHHEHWDGSGYPEGRSETRIPISARVMAVADVYDALTGVRSYREAVRHKAAIQEIADLAGVQFDPLVVDVFLRQETLLASIKDQFAD